MWRTIKLYLIGAVIAGLAGLVLYYRFVPQHPEKISAPAVLKQIEQLCELVTVRYNIQKVVGLKEQKVPFGSEQVLVQARVHGGVNLSNVTVRVAGDTVWLRLPAAEILDVAIDDKETKVWDRSKTWWTPWVSLNPDLEQSARRAAVEDVRAAAEQMGICSNAQVNAEIVLRNFLQTIGVKHVSFEASSQNRRN
jgi:Protein of unknown function (DUF4230)